MKKIVVFVILQLIWTVGSCENLRFTHFGTPIPACADLDVHWNGPSNAFPRTLWIYHLLPSKFTSNTIHTLMEIGSFTDKNRVGSGTNEMRFRSTDGSRTLVVSFPLGVVDYETVVRHNPTNLVNGIPSKQEAVALTKQLLPKLGVKLADIDKKEHSGEPEFHVGDEVITFYVDKTFITNIVERGVGFRRAVDGVAFLSVGTGGDGSIEFGDHAKITKIYLSWRNLERDKAYPTVTRDRIMESIRKGHAVQGYLRSDSPGIDWPTAKSVNISNAWPCYYAGDPLVSSDWLYPFVALDTTVDTGSGDVHVEIDCPIIEEAGK